MHETINCVLRNLRIIQQTMPPFECGGDLQSNWDVDFLQDVLFESEWDDCTLSGEDMKHFTTPPTESWNGLPSDSNPAVFEIDLSKIYQWTWQKRRFGTSC